MQRLSSSSSTTPTPTSPSSSPTAATTPRSTTPPSLSAVRAGGTSVEEGHRGPVVREVQTRLNAAGADPALRDDGAFGPLTRSAVEQFQRQQGLEVDGRVGPRTLAALEALGQARPADGIDAGGGPRRQGPAPARTTPSPAAMTTTTTPRRGLGGAAGSARPPIASAGTTPSPALPAGLPAAAATRTAAVLAGTNGPEAQRAVRELMTSAPYRALPETAQARLLATATRPVGVAGIMGGLAAAAGAGSSTAARDRLLAGRVREAGQLLASPAMTRSSAADRARIVDVYAAAPGPQTLRLAGVGGADRLTGRDLRGGTMLTSLHQLATAPLAAGLNRGELLRSTIAEVENPANIEQHRQGTCAATSVTLRVAERSPAEYARLVAGLASPAGRATLADGSTVARNNGSIGDTRTGRTQSERLLQDSFMGFANGNLNYDVAADTSQGDGGGGGLNNAEVSRLQSSVFGEPYRTVTTVGRMVPRDASIGAQMWNNIRNNFDRLTFQHNPNAPMEMLQQELNAGRSAQIGMRWGEAGHSGHAVVVTRIDNGRVYFQNPHGNVFHGQAVGSSLSPPPRRVERDNVQSMTLADFQARLTSVSIRE